MLGTSLSNRRDTIERWLRRSHRRPDDLWRVKVMVIRFNRLVQARELIRDRGWQWRPISVRQEAMFNLYVVDQRQRRDKVLTSGN